MRNSHTVHALLLTALCSVAVSCGQNRGTDNSASSDTTAIREVAQGPVQGLALRALGGSSLLRSLVTKDTRKQDIVCWYRVSPERAFVPLTTVWAEVADFADFFGKTPLSESLNIESLIRQSQSKEITTDLNMVDFNAVVLSITTYDSIMTKDGYDPASVCPPNPDSFAAPKKRVTTMPAATKPAPRAGVTKKP